MNFSELILSEDKIIVFIIVTVIAFILYYYLKGLIPNHVDLHPGVLFVLLYILFYVIDRMVVTNVHFSQPITNYILKKRNFREEPYHIKYINPFVTNLDKVDFNMKKRQNKEYVKNILSQLIIRKYIQFENVLGYLPNPWEIIKLEEEVVATGTPQKYKINDNEISSSPNDDKITDNMYCMNYLTNSSSDPKFLLLYRKHVLKFMDKQYFIFEKKNKKHSKYYLRECISQVVIVDPATNSKNYTIVDTRDLHYDRQYILFIGLPSNDATTSDKFKKWISPPISEYTFATKYKYYNKFRDDPVQYHWQNDGEIHDVIVLDIHFIYNQMLVLNEEIFDDDGSAQDFALNKYYERNDWIEKKYFNFIKYQFSNRIGPASTSTNTDTETNKLQVIKSNNSNSVTSSDATTIKFRKAIGKIKDYNTNFGDASFNLQLNNFKESKNIYDTAKAIGESQSALESKAQADNYINKNLLNNRDYLKIIKTPSIDGITIDFMKYIRNYIQNVPEKPANELVIVKNKKTKYSKDNDLILDQNTISYVSFNFLNIKTIKEYRDKMKYIADSIMNKYYKKEVQSIDKIKYNLESLQIIQLDKLLRYDSGRKRLSLQGRTITPNNIGTYYKDIKKLRAAYKNFLEKTLKYKKTLKENIDSNNYSLNVTNNELLAIVNNNTLNVKSKYLGKISHIQKLKKNDSSISLGAWDNTHNLNHDQTISDIYNEKLIRLRIVNKTYKKPKNHPLFVQFSTTMNKNGFSINKDNVYIVHHLKVDELLIPRYIYLERYLLERDISNNEVKIALPSQPDNPLLKPINIVDCTNSFRKETIGVSNLTRIIGKNKFKIIFDNTPLEFKPLVDDSEGKSNNMFIDRPNYVMLNFSKNTDINEIQNKIYENQLYKVIEVTSTSSSSSAELILESLIDIDMDTSTDTELNDIYKDILVSQFINSKNYIENVYFKKVEVPKADRLLNDGPLYKFVVELKKQIINITPEITREDIIANYETTMTKIIDYIYENEAKKIHYEIPTNIGIYKDTSSAVYTYKYKNNLYITYDKRNGPVNLFKNYSSEYLCKKIYRGNNFAVNMNSLYYLDSYQEYYQYFINLFKNTLGLHDEINYQCNEYYKSGSMLSNLKLPITFNKYVTFQNNYMLYYKTNIRIDDIDKKLLGKHVVINNTICDNQLITVLNSNRMNSRLYKNFLREFIYKHEIGREGFEYDDAKKICERIFTVYDTNCPNQIYKKQSSDPSDYNLSYYKHNKERDTCFTTLYNDDKTKDTYQFITESKLLDPTQDTENDITTLKDNLKDITSLKYTCSSKLNETSCISDPNCYYDSKAETCKSLYTKNQLTYVNKAEDGTPIGYVTNIEIEEPATGDTDEYTRTSDTDIGPNKNIATTLNLKKDQLIFFNTNIWYNISTNINPSIKLYKHTLYKVNKEYQLQDRSGSIVNLGVGTFSKTKNDFMTGIGSSGYSSNNEGPFQAFYINDPYRIKLKLNKPWKGSTLKGKNIYFDKNNLLDIPQLRSDTIFDKVPEKYIEDDGSITTNQYDKYTYKVHNVKEEDDSDDETHIIIAISNKNHLDDTGINNIAIYPDNTININPFKNLIRTKQLEFKQRMEEQDTDTDTSNVTNYKAFVKAVEDTGNLRFYPHRLAHLNEIKTAAYYGADWDDIGWINDANPQIYNKSNLVKIQDKKVMWIDKEDKNAINKGVICYGRKINQEKIGANQKNEMYNFQMEKIEQSIKDIQKYENVSDFNKEVYSRWNL